MSRIARSPFAHAALGGLVVGILGWIAIAVGWVEPKEGDEAPPPVAATQPVSDAGGDRDGLTVGQIYERAADGVAHIEARGRTAAAPVPFGPPQPSRTATGSGFLIDERGHVVTNAHVVAGADDVTVTLGTDEESYEAEIVGADPSTDIAVLRVDADADELEPLELGDSTKLEVGEPVVAIGNPFGLDRTVTTGIVSALQREIRAPDGFSISDVIQTDAAINPGNSGGPLLDGAGRVVGVNSQIESSSGGNQGIGFAVPISTASEIAQQLIADGEVHHAFLGISGADLTPAVAEAINLDADSGVLVQSVVPDSPADEAGIEPGEAIVNAAGERVRVGGDIIVGIDGKPVGSMDDVVSAIARLEPGDEVELSVRRGDDERDVTVKLGKRPSGAG